jgi:hypothetical protein
MSDDMILDPTIEDEFSIEPGGVKRNFGSKGHGGDEDDGDD